MIIVIGRIWLRMMMINGEDVDGNGNGDDAYDKHTIIYDEVDEYTAA